jgi:alpha-beta hydrolase superfamily lysophospholipase
MQKIIDKLGIVRIVIIVVAILLIGGAWVMVGRMYNGLEVRRFTQDDIPLLFMAPEGASGVPGVIIAHGFGGSQQLMLGYGLSFARAGYGVMLLNFSGHASNPGSLSTSRSTLQNDMDIVFEAITAQPEIDPDQIALLGHSMGSGAVMNAGITDPGRYAAVMKMRSAFWRMRVVRAMILPASAPAGSLRFPAWNISRSSSAPTVATPHYRG